MFSKKNKKVLAICCAALFLFFVPLAFDANPLLIAHAFDLAWLNPTFHLLIGIQTVLAYILEVGILLLSTCIDAEKVTGMLTDTSVSEAWSAVRDACNVAFILTLLFSAFATIFQVDKYHIKTIIVKLVLMALLVNFSYPITRFIIDTGNVPMYFLAETLFGKVKNNLGQQISQKSNVVCVLVPHMSGCPQKMSEITYWNQTEVSQILGSIVALFIFATTMVTLSILFVIRTVALTIFLIFSPLGFVGIAVPALSKYAHEFWENLVKYVMFGPIMLFLLAISLKLMSSFNSYGLTGDTGLTGFGVAMAKVTVPIVILWMGIIVAQKSSIWGAGIMQKFTVKAAKSIGHFAGHFADQKMALWGQRLSEKGDWNIKGKKVPLSGFATRTLGKSMRLMSPTAVSKALKAIREKDDAEAFGRASYGLQDQITSLRDHATSFLNPRAYVKGAKGGFKGGAKEAYKQFFYGVDKTSELYDQTAREAKKASKDLPTSNFEYVFDELNNALDQNSIKDVQATLLAMVDNNDINDLILDHGDKFGGSKELNPTNMREVLDNIYKKAGVSSEEERAKYMMMLSDIGSSRGNFNLAALGRYKDGKFKVRGYKEQSDIDEHAQAAVSKFMNLEGQERQKKMHPDNFFTYTREADGTKKFTGISSVGKAILNGLQGDDLAQSNRTRGDIKNIAAEYVDYITSLSNNSPEYQRLSNEFNNAITNDIGRQYIIALKNQKDGMNINDALQDAKNSNKL